MLNLQCYTPHCQHMHYGYSIYCCKPGKRHSKRGKKMERARGSTTAKSLSMYSITENIYYSQLPYFLLLLWPERNCFTSYNTRKGLCSLSPCAIVLRSSPPSHLSACNGQESWQLFCVHYTWSLQFFHRLGIEPLWIKLIVSKVIPPVTAKNTRPLGQPVTPTPRTQQMNCTDET
jgi:hypothetical protein